MERRFKCICMPFDGAIFTYDTVTNMYLSGDCNVAFAEDFITKHSDDFIEIFDQKVAISINRLGKGNYNIYIYGFQHTAEELYKILNDALNPA